MVYQSVERFPRRLLLSERYLSPLLVGKDLQVERDLLIRKFRLLHSHHLLENDGRILPQISHLQWLSSWVVGQ